MQEIQARVEGIRRYTIHGQPYAVVYYSTPDEPEHFRNAQLSEDALPANLRVGESITVQMLLGLVTGMQRRGDFDASAPEMPLS